MEPLKNRVSYKTVILLGIVVLGFAAMGILNWRQTVITQTAGAASGGDDTTFLPLLKIPLPLSEVYTTAFGNPTFVTHVGDERLFVVRKDGVIHILHPDQQASVFLDIQDRVLTELEQGLYSLIFDPEYATNGFFYVAYSGERYTGEHWFLVSRFRATNDVADPNSECYLFGLPMDYTIHNGGGMILHPFDGHLYVGIGDDRGLLAAQEDDNYKGKLVRLTISDLPTNSCATAQKQIVAKGLRNPWRFDFDPVTGDIYIADVGDLNWEEVNVIPYGNWGMNFGWPCMEGPVFIGFPIQTQCEPVGTGDLPLYYYPHHPQCAIIGGYVLRRPGYPSPQFLYGDACTRELFLLTNTGGNAAVERLGTLTGSGYILTSFGKDYEGNLYAMDLPNTIYRLHIP